MRCGEEDVVKSERRRRRGGGVMEDDEDEMEKDKGEGTRGGEQENKGQNK